MTNLTKLRAEIKRLQDKIALPKFYTQDSAKLRAELEAYERDAAKAFIAKHQEKSGFKTGEIIANLTAENKRLTAELEQVKADHAELVRACEVYVRDSYPPAHSFDMQRFRVMETALAKLQGSKE